MSEILDVKEIHQQAYWLILACGHWYKWTGGQAPPQPGERELNCPSCNPPVVVIPADPVT